MALDGAPDLPARRLAEAHAVGFVPDIVKNDESSALATPFGVTTAEVCGLSESFAASKSLATARGALGRYRLQPRLLRDACRLHGGGQTVRRLRPLRRRRERTLRPFLVLIRSRKPCVFLRRRLFG